VEKKAESRWGSGFMKNLSRDLKEVNPDATCFSETNLLYMKNFYLLYHPYLEITPQLVEQIRDDLFITNRIAIRSFSTSSSTETTTQNVTNKTSR
jgi:hypothetical protein